MAAAFAAGVLNAVAGGGSFLTLPVLIFAGVPPTMANATSALAVRSDHLGSILGFKQERRELPGRRLVREMAICAVGGVAGALLLLLVTPASLFAGIVPWLMLFAPVLFAPVLFAADPRIAAWARVGQSQADAASYGPRWRCWRCWRGPSTVAISMAVWAVC
jgi:hypothetical protein